MVFFNDIAFHKVVPYDPAADKLLLLDFTAANPDLQENIWQDTQRLDAYIQMQLQRYGARYGIGGYNEHRVIYGRSQVFDGNGATEEPRRLHLGIDIWGEAGIPVSAPADAIVHSFANNDAYGDYGATIILQHKIKDITWHSLYGHLSAQDLIGLQPGSEIKAGTVIAHFGKPEENGQWPPHLHFQLIMDMQGKKGDYPGVCRYSEREQYLQNCPDPDLILHMMRYAVRPS